jgi:hypothetical protein
MKETLQLCANPWDGNGRNVSCRTVLKLCFGLDILVRHRKVKNSHLLSLVWLVQSSRRVPGCACPLAFCDSNWSQFDCIFPLGPIAV